MAYITGSIFNDSLTGTNGNDTIKGFPDFGLLPADPDGNDTLFGLGSFDCCLLDSLNYEFRSEQSMKRSPATASKRAIRFMPFLSQRELNQESSWCRISIGQDVRQNREIELVAAPELIVYASLKGRSENLESPC